MAELDIARDGAVATLTLNRPAAMNALSVALRRQLAEAVAGLAGDPAVRVLVLTGAGDRAFCAGLDLKELGRDAGALGSIEARVVDPVTAIEACPKPVIAAVNGVAVTGIVEDPTPLRKVYEPGHPDADANGYVTRPNVDAVVEMTDMVAATRAFQANVTAFEATKSMAKDSLRIIS